MTNPNFLDTDVEQFMDIYGTKKTSVLRNKVINSPLHLSNKIECYCYNYKTKIIKRYYKFDHLLEFKTKLLENNEENKFKFYGINVYSLIINFYTDDMNRNSNILLLKLDEDTTQFIKYFEDIGFKVLRKTSFNRIILLDIGKEEIESILMLISLQFSIDGTYEIIKLVGDKIIIG